MLRKLTGRLAAPARAAMLSLGLAALGAVGAGVVAAPVAAQTAFAPAAIVNEDVITYYDVVQRARILELGGATPGPALNRAALEQLIDDRLRMQVGERLKIEATEEEILAGFNELGARQGKDGAGMIADLQAQGVDEAAIRDVVVSQIVWNRVVTSRFNTRATPSEGELDTEIEIAASSTEQRFRLAEIAVPATEADFDQATAFLNNLRNDIAGGASFGDLARKNSRSPTAQQGGVIGWVPQSSLPPAMSEELANIGVGGITRPLQIPGGAAIFLVLDAEASAPAWTNTTTYSLQRISVPLTEGAVDRAAALTADVTECGDLPDFDEDVTTARLNDVQPSTLTPLVQSAIADLKAGDKTAPVPSENTMDVYLVCSKRVGVPDEVRQQVREQIRSQRLTRLAEGFLQEQRRDAVIERR